MRVRESQATTVAAPFLEIADVLECDLTRGDTDVGSPQQSESDTESVGHHCMMGSTTTTEKVEVDKECQERRLPVIATPGQHQISSSNCQAELAPFQWDQSSPPAKMVSRKCSVDMGCCRRR